MTIATPPYPSAPQGLLPPEEELTRDWLLDRQVSLVQPARGYRVAIDPVLLAAFVPLSTGQSLLDMGCGTGAALLCVQARARRDGVLEGLTLAGLEKDPVHAAFARRNQQENGLHAPIVGHDLAEKAHPALFPAVFPVAENAEAGISSARGRKSRRRGFDHIIMNPPYMEAGTASLSPHQLRNRAHIENGNAGLDCWFRRAAELLRPGGRLGLVHRADRLPGILTALAAHFGEVTILPLWPRAGVAARRVLVAARKGLGAPARLLPGLALHLENGSFTPAADRILRQGAALDSEDESRE